jgi:hypothetical protein
LIENGDVNQFLQAINSIIEVTDFNQQTIIFYGNSADSIISSSVLFLALSSNNYNVIHTEFDPKKLSTYLSSDKKNYFFIDISEQIELADTNNNFIIFNYEDHGIANINCNTIYLNKFGFSPSNSNLTAISYFLTTNLSLSKTTESNILKFTIISSFIDNQNILLIDRKKGLFDIIIEKGLKIKLFQELTTFVFTGKINLSIKNTIYYSILPFLPTLTGNSNRIEEFLNKININKEINGIERTFSDLQQTEITELISLFLSTLTHSKYPGKIKLLSKTIVNLKVSKKSLFYDLRESGQYLINAYFANQVSLIVDSVLGRLNIDSSLSRLFVENKKKSLSVVTKVLNYDDDIRYQQILYIDKLETFQEFFIVSHVVFIEINLFPNDFQMLTSQINELIYVSLIDRSGEQSDINTIVNNLVKEYKGKELKFTELQFQKFIVIKNVELKEVYNFLNKII